MKYLLAIFALSFAFTCLGFAMETTIPNVPAVGASYGCEYRFNVELDWKKLNIPEVKVYLVKNHKSHNVTYVMILDAVTVTRRNASDDWNLEFIHSVGRVPDLHKGPQCPGPQTYIVVQPD